MSDSALKRDHGPLRVLITEGSHVAARLIAHVAQVRRRATAGIDATFAYLQKPITVETLTTKVRDVLDGPQR